MNMRRLCLLGSLLVSGLVMLGACGDNGGSSGSSGSGGTTGSVGGARGGTGGAKGTGGATGATGGHAAATGGSTGAGGANPCASVPSCLSFLANCSPSGACMSQTTVTLSPPSATLSKCYGNGVKEATTGSLSGGAVTSGTTMVSRNGSFCYSYDLSLGAGGTSGSNSSLTFKNASGGVLATVVSVNGTTTTFSCGGQMYQVPNSCTTAVASIETGTACTSGTCQ